MLFWMLRPGRSTQIILGKSRSSGILTPADLENCVHREYVENESYDVNKS